MKSALAIILLALVAAGHCRAMDEAERFFAGFVKPLLDSRCVSCHGPEKVKGGLRLDSREAVLKAGDSGRPAVVPGRPSESLLLQAVMHSAKDLEMPPKEKLTTHDIAVLERWIQEGASWPTEQALAGAGSMLKPGERLGDAWSDPRNPIVRLFGGQRLDLWSLKPVRRVAPPRVRNQRWIRTPLDAFALAHLEKRGESPRLRADGRTLVRRLYFDLTGLPPTPEQVATYLADPRPDAYERLVEALLQSPAYGEHWARLWLDVVRYSDSNGFDWDEFRPRAWQFRDYVIRSIRSDKPFDRFIREQLAGDELFEGPPETEAQRDALIATGYLRLGPQDNSASLFNEQDRARAELMADLTETTAGAFLGLTMSCCRCHDHKFDPLSQADHFRMRAFFEPVKYADELPVDLAAEQEAVRRHNQAVEKELEPVQRERDALLAGVKERLRAGRLAKLPDDERALLALPKAQRTDDLKARVEAIEKKVAPSDKEVKAALNSEEKERHKLLEKEVAALNGRKRSFTYGLLMTDSSGKIPPTHVLFQGDHKATKERVEPGFLSALDPNPAAIRAPINRKTTGRRLTLAEWIASPDNPLTARVFVNRVWQAYFGSGLVETPNDFGLAGARPAHPELLDWLALRFMEDGWSLRRLHRLIVLSAVYQQGPAPSSARATGATGATVSLAGPAHAGPDTLHFAVHREPRRLTAEQLRDALLAVSGLLTHRSGGPPVWPDLPPEILQANPAFLDDNATKTKGWYPSPKPEQNVRSIYLVQKKTVRVPFMETFDLPENSVSCARRNVSTVAPQALSLLNSPLAIEAAQAFAERVRREAGDDPARQLERAFRLAFQRAPTRPEVDLCSPLLREHGLVVLCRSVLNLNEFVYVD